ncbi:MAG: uroporphyrinogen decarboxylase family protein [Deltaproteobacteria bacterium]|nr:uroporphyrinogen decarboxylase family protein [Deltaproteobacteria bacterium]
MTTLNSMQRVLTALGHQEPDRVPFFLLLTMHGAKEAGLSIREYFSKAEYVAEGQLRMQARYRHDCLYGFFHAPLEIEAWGGEVVFCDDGPPNSGQSPISDIESILRLEPPAIESSTCLHPVLEAQRLMKERVGDTIPIIGVVMSPFSLPVMQLGFDRYLEMIYERPDLFQALMRINTEFCVSWANAQLEAGATAICYFDPVASPTILPREIYHATGFNVACETISRIKGPTATHLASGRLLGIEDLICQTGTAAVGVSTDEDLAVLKEACRGKISLLGNLNGIAMRTWTPETAHRNVCEVIQKGAPGGGFILSDNHGEIPFHVSDEVLMAISDAVHSCGRYPIITG